MKLRLGVIADDFTGATDIAGFLVSAGLRTVQLNQPSVEEVLRTAETSEAEAIVVGLKTRSAPPRQAVDASLEAARALRNAGATRFVFKYCSTFDSTAQGNIGPVTDALLDDLDLDFTVVVPALPVNGRTVYRGHLFVGDEPLNESGMRHHPVTPMTDSNLVRLMSAQSRGHAIAVPYDVVRQGAQAVRASLDDARSGGARYAVLDTLDDDHLQTIGEACKELVLVTGGSGVGGAIGRVLSSDMGRPASQPAPSDSWTGTPGFGIVLSGSASQMTNRQVARYRQLAPALPLDVSRIIADGPDYLEEVLTWIGDNGRSENRPDPLVYATAGAEHVRSLQEKHGAEVTSEAIEEFFAQIAHRVLEDGYTRFVVAGGETSGAVTQALGVSAFRVGPQIAPGVPWTKSTDGRLDLALKSGNFGDEDFFSSAQNTMREGRDFHDPR
ncbi:3-oxo-tetronate kinase [Rothia sp. HC945]|jgi:uncharacterized protein YgbK (DUF1537 family)|uniref:3-oxo-tetronate kinase n=1 Tax=Rothia sp. HC945 TaxID=3171170 RepID=UPI0026533E3A|nr:four-carbon acid sugar kinase family protein [Kocuria sp.]MDN5617027.1 four-carbon acid sugar kinase family protein [Kocuria sp.]MDN5653991.1 four-carbon acid sugar kinase family protein [Kocuria sp.]